MASTNTFDILPSELLSKIFEAGLEHYEPLLSRDGVVSTVMIVRHDYLESICLVSQRWNAVAIETPTLWSMVSISCYDSAIFSTIYKFDPYRRHRLHLERAKASPLNICLHMPWYCFRDSGPSRSFWKFWEELKKKHDQWMSIETCREEIQDLEHLEGLIPHSLPNLETIELGIAAVPVGWQGAIIAPKLRAYGCLGALGFVVPFTQLAQLEDLRIGGAVPRATRVFEHLKSIRNLEVSSAVFDEDDTPWEVELNCLETMTIAGNMGSMHIFLQSLRCPHLHTISFRQVKPSYSLPGISDIPPLTVTYPSLKLIEYGTQITGRILILSFLRALTNLEEITVRFSTGSMSVRTRSTPEDFHRVDDAMLWIERQSAGVEWYGSKFAGDWWSWEEARAMLPRLRHS